MRTLTFTRELGKCQHLFLSLNWATFHTGLRFMQVPRPIMDKDLITEEKEITDDINSLVKKVRRYYITYLNSYSPRVSE
jgi:hypothetical protein